MDADAEEAAARQRQLWQLDAVEAAWRAEHEAKQETSYYAASYSSWVNYGSSIVGNIVANLQVTLDASWYASVCRDRESAVLSAFACFGVRVVHFVFVSVCVCFLM